MVRFCNFDCTKSVYHHKPHDKDRTQPIKRKLLYLSMAVNIIGRLLRKKFRLDILTPNHLQAQSGNVKCLLCNPLFIAIQKSPLICKRVAIRLWFHLIFSHHFLPDTYLNLNFVPYFISSEVMQVDISSGTKCKIFIKF